MNQKPKYGQLLVAAYGGIGILGTFLLMLPWASTQPGTTSFLQAWFTSMSSLTVTGLTVVNTGYHWTVFGQAVILFLIQVGGLGLMVLTTLLLIAFGYRMNLGYRVFAAEEQKQFSFSGIGTLFRKVALLVMAIELTGTIFLYLALPDNWGEGILKGIFFALFHAVSAFNGAGLDITGASLVPYKDSVGVNVIMMTMILLGSLGYVVLLELRSMLFNYHRPSLHCRLVLVVTGLITLGGSIFYLLTEYNSSLAGLTLSQQIVESLFQCVTRTAGFITVPVLSWSEPFQFLMIIMMFIGASPGSVGGGIKTTTFGVIVLAAWAIARGKKTVVVSEREIDPASISKAFTVTVMALTLVCIGTLTIMVLEQLPFMPVLFEVVSALATVGLSMGITEQMSPVGLVIIGVFMFVGRIGVLSLVLFLAKPRENRIRYMKENIFID